MPEDDARFSILSRLSEPTKSTASESRDFRFQSIVEETRAYLIGYNGDGSQQDKQRHLDMMNRAVLGYEEERKLLFAMIQQFLLQKRWSSDNVPDGRYTSLAEAVFSDIIGMNVLELLLKNKTGIEEIQVVGTKVYVVRGGQPRASGYDFRTISDVERLQQNLVLFNQDTLNIRKRWAEVRLNDGARVTLTGFGFTAEPTLTIRFYQDQLLTLEDLCDPAYATMNMETASLLRSLVRARVNLIIAGPTNSGKTQLLKALVKEMPDEERLITIESRFELFLERDFPAKNIIQYEIQEDDPLHNGQQAFKLALRQSPTRIIHAEIRDEDANLYVRACTRGHAGSLTTVHAGSLEDVPDVIADMCMMDGRAVNHDRLARRIAEHVTEVGIELAVIDGVRKVMRVGEYVTHNSVVQVRTLAAYEQDTGGWTHPNTPSEALLRKLNTHYTNNKISKLHKQNEGGSIHIPISDEEGRAWSS